MCACVPFSNVSFLPDAKSKSLAWDNISTFVESRSSKSKTHKKRERKVELSAKVFNDNDDEEHTQLCVVMSVLVGGEQRRKSRIRWLYQPNWKQWKWFIVVSIFFPFSLSHTQIRKIRSPCCVASAPKRFQAYDCMDSIFIQSPQFLCLLWSCRGKPLPKEKHIKLEEHSLW